jgi:hypothetical protein
MVKENQYRGEREIRIDTLRDGIQLEEEKREKKSTKQNERPAILKPLLSNIFSK